MSLYPVIFIALFSVIPKETELWKLYRTGDITSITKTIEFLPDTVPHKLFFKSALEENGLKAATTFEMIARKFPDSQAAPFAIERLAAFNAVAGKMAEAGSYRDLLKKRYPDFKGTINLDVLLPTSKPVAIPFDEPRGRETPPVWTIQAGAFRNKAGAETVGKKISAFGKVKYLEKNGRKGKITIVTVGEFKEIKTAEETAVRIKNETGLDLVVVRIETK